MSKVMHLDVLQFPVILQTGNSDAFEIPLSYVNQCNPGKNEVTLEFHPVRPFTKSYFVEVYSHGFHSDFSQSYTPK
jgi:hypothetical protein